MKNEEKSTQNNVNLSRLTRLYQIQSTTHNQYNQRKDIHNTLVTKAPESNTRNEHRAKKNNTKDQSCSTCTVFLLILITITS